MTVWSIWRTCTLNKYSENLNARILCTSSCSFCSTVFDNWLTSQLCQQTWLCRHLLAKETNNVENCSEIYSEIWWLQSEYNLLISHCSITLRYYSTRNENLKQAKILKLLSWDQNVSSLNLKFSPAPQYCKGFKTVRPQFLSTKSLKSWRSLKIFIPASCISCNYWETTSQKLGYT